MNRFKTLSKPSLIGIVILLTVCLNGTYSLAHAAEGAGSALLHDSGESLNNLVAESSELVHRPFKIDNGAIYTTMAVAGAWGLTYLFDSDIRDKVQANKSNFLHSASDVGNTVGNPFIHLGAAAAVYGGGLAIGSDEWKKTGQMAMEALVLTDAVGVIIKEASGRARPTVSHDSNRYKPFSFTTDYDSLPSLHTASSFAMASLLSSRTENMYAKIGYYTTAAFVGYSRLYSNKHWASDVLLGAVLGELAARLVISRHNSSGTTAIVPQIYQNGAGLAMVKTW